jgi:hypothetical protein
MPLSSNLQQNALGNNLFFHVNLNAAKAAFLFVVH